MMRQALAALLLAALPFTSWASDWPRKPVKVIVNFTPGGPAEKLARIVAPGLGAELGVPIVVETRPGAGGNIGADFVAKSAPDGHTLLLSSAGLFSTNPHLYKSMGFSPLDDLAPIAAVGKVPFFLAVPATLPAKSASDLLALHKTLKHPLTYGSPGNGSAPHITAAQLAFTLGFEATHVAYKGAAPALTDLLAGQIHFLFDPGIALQHVQSGKLRALGVASLQRHPNHPEIPTLAEQGLKGFDFDSVFGLYAPKAVPPEVLKRLETTVRRTLAEPAVQAQVLGIGNVPVDMGAAELDRKNRAESQKISAIVRKAGIQVE